MGPHIRRHRLRRTLRWLAGLLLFALAWKLFWRYAPPYAAAGRPALFPLQAKALLRAHLADRPVDGTLPAPEKGTSAEAQLRLMGLWDGRTWTAKAAGLGRVEGRALKVAAGRLVPGTVGAVSAERVEQGVPTCRVEYRLRWDWPDPDRELQRVAGIVGFRAAAPPGFSAPGQEVGRSLDLQRAWWGWQPKPEPGARAVPRQATGLWSAVGWLL